MADYTPAHLCIGGEITNEQYREIQCLTNDGAEAVWGEGYDLWHNEAPWGAFPELETYLIAAGIAFDRYSKPALGYDGQMVQFRPGMDAPVLFTASGDPGERLVLVREILAILDAHPPGEAGSERLVSQLRDLCDPAVDALPPFRVR